jgi:hypothetical protein
MDEVISLRTEGYGLQAVHDCCVMNSALAAEGCLPLKTSIFPDPVRSLFSLADHCNHLGIDLTITISYSKAYA